MSKVNFKLVISAILGILFIFSGIAFLPAFYSDTDTSSSFVPDNFSNTIYVSNPTEIFFNASGKDIRYIYTQFIPNSETSHESRIYLSVKDSEDNVISQAVFDGNDIFSSSDVNISVNTPLKKGRQYSLLIESDAANEDSGWRIPIGPHTECDIYMWTYNNIQDSTLTPGIHIVYNKFGMPTFAFCCLCAAAILCAVLLPKTKIEEKLKMPAGIFLFMAAPFINVFFCELCNYSSIFDKGAAVAAITYLICFSVQLFSLALFGTSSAAVIASGFIFTVFSAANHFVKIFRGSSITFFDLKVAGTAANVVSEYAFEADSAVIIMCMVFFMISAFSIRFNFSLNRKKPLVKRVASASAGIALMLFSLSSSTLAATGAGYDPFSPVYSVENLGVIYNFSYGITTSRLIKPEGYNKDALTEENISYTGTSRQEGQTLPDIILIMNEGLADYSSFVSLDVSQEPLTFIKSLAEAENSAVKSVISPVIGGGTCNPEFEAITGMSIRNFSSACYPFAQYMEDSSYSMAKYVKTLGYNTTYIHPGDPTSYNRENVYIQLGFDEIFFADDFDNPQYIRNFISDKSCYDMILDVLDQTEQPQFIFNVTIQNHGAWPFYNGDNAISLGGASGEDLASFENILSLYKDSDEAFEYLINRLKERERPTVVIMFGDHHPSISAEVKNFIHVDSIFRQNPLSEYQTPIVFWANYDIDTSDIPDIFSTNYISAVMANCSGIPLNGQQQFLLEMMENVPVYSTAGIFDTQLNPVDYTPYAGIYRRNQYAALREPDLLPDEFLKTE